MDVLDIKDMKIQPCINSRFLVPSRVNFKQNGVERTWDYIKVHDSVAILIFNVTRQAFVLVKQFRPALYMGMNTRANSKDVSVVQDESLAEASVPFQSGVAYEMCAGIVDQNRPVIEIAKNEILEETGYEVSLTTIIPLYEYYSVGFSGNKCTMFYAEVTDDMKIQEGGGNEHEGEFIEICYLSLNDAKSFMYNPIIPKGSGLISALSWYFLNKN